MSTPIAITQARSERMWACPAATRLQAAEVSRPAWLAARRAGVGGSELAALMGEARYGSAYQVWLDKTGRTDRDDGDASDVSEAMLWGQRLEAAVADAFAEQQGLQVRRAGLMRSRTRPRMLASVDRLTSDGGGLEVKCVNFFAGKQLANGQIPQHWYWQMVHYLTVTGRSHWWLAVLVGGQRLQVRRVERSDAAADMARAAQAVTAFWDEHVQSGIAPIDGAPAVVDQVEVGTVSEAALGQAVLADVARWRELAADTMDTEAELAAIKARLTAEIGDAAVLTVCGVPLVRQVFRKGASRFNRAGLRSAQPELEAQFTTLGAPTRHVELYRTQEDR